MRSTAILRVLAAGALALTTVHASQQTPPPAPAAAPGSRTLTLAEIVEGLNRAENALTQNMMMWKPLVEVYIQNLRPDEQLGMVPVHDTYFLGRFDWRENAARLVELSVKEVPRGERKVEYIPDGFAAMATPDWFLLDPSRYDFSIVRREFLGEVRTYVLDVSPKKDPNDGFSGRIWVEDRGLNIVRYNGINRRVERTLIKKRIPLHIDGWRANPLPGMWLPAYVYCEETDLGDRASSAKGFRFKSHVKFWGFDPSRATRNSQFTAIEIVEPEVRDAAEPAAQLSPVLSQRRWEQEAEANVIERLEKASLLAPVGEVEKVLDTVINNLLVTNEIPVDRPVNARVLLTSPLESFTIGHTIVLSRGLIDVLPDEASLAMMLAHELGHVVLGHQTIDTRFAFADRMMLTDGDLLRMLKVTRPPREESAADAKVMEMLKKSPYHDKLSDAGLFLRVVGERAKVLPNLIHPHIGEHINDGGVLRLNELMQQSPALEAERLDQIGALPLGARLILDPWSGRLGLLKTATQPLKSAREKVPLAVTPLIPYIKYADPPQASR